MDFRRAKRNHHTGMILRDARCIFPDGIRDGLDVVVRDGKIYCSRTCAYDCTETTCLCVHEKCGDQLNH